MPSRPAWMIMLALLVTACDRGPETPAPVGRLATLQTLASEYEALADTLPTSPMQLPAEDRKRFVETVFRDGGYSYAATLKALARGEWDKNDKNARDLVELVTLPHRQLRAGESMEGLYSEDELAAIRAIEAHLR